VVAVELDDALASLLRRELSQFSNVTIVNANILDLEPDELLRRYAPARSEGQGSYKVVANLPYYVAAHVLRHFLEASHRPVTMVVMVQREVGEAIVASPGRMGLLSLGVQVYGKPSIVARVPSGSFQPRPKVDSAVVAIEVYERPVVSDVEGFFRVAKAGFSAPRKQLHNALAQGLDVPVQQVKEQLDRVGIDGRRRAGTLTVKEWDALCQVFP
jgi:16S rRNA (adenine1518-N6/adenine1519-N6)-dimethyltransferase